MATRSAAARVPAVPGQPTPRIVCRLFEEHPEKVYANDIGKFVVYHHPIVNGRPKRMVYRLPEDFEPDPFDIDAGIIAEHLPDGQYLWEARRHEGTILARIEVGVGDPEGGENHDEPEAPPPDERVELIDNAEGKIVDVPGLPPHERSAFLMAQKNLENERRQLKEEREELRRAAAAGAATARPAVDPFEMMLKMKQLEMADGGGRRGVDPAVEAAMGTLRAQLDAKNAEMLTLMRQHGDALADVRKQYDNQLNELRDARRTEVAAKDAELVKLRGEKDAEIVRLAQVHAAALAAKDAELLTVRNGHATELSTLRDTHAKALAAVEDQHRKLVVTLEGGFAEQKRLWQLQEETLRKSLTTTQEQAWEKKKENDEENFKLARELAEAELAAEALKAGITPKKSDEEGLQEKMAKYLPMAKNAIDLLRALGGGDLRKGIDAAASAAAAS